jgi:hypothetical protein
MRCSPQELLAEVRAADARACVFPLHEPDGYGAANAAVLAAAAASDGRLVAFARLDPHADPLAEARRCLDAGARGIKLHPRAERFALDAPALDDVWALAHERRLPVIVHAGRGIPALGAQAVEICTRFPGVQLILAHAGICDLAWIGARARELPNLLFDTSWWGPSDLLALFATVPPGQILFASDTPYGRVRTGALQTSRLALQAGLSEQQVRLVLGGQLARLLAGESPHDAGGPPAGAGTTVDVLLDRVATYLTGAFGQLVLGSPASEMLALARLACALPADAPRAAHGRVIAELLERFTRLAAEPAPPGRRIHPAAHLLVLAMNVARTPAVPVPDALVD